MIRNPDVIVTVERGVAAVDIRRSYLIAEVRDYDVDETDEDHPQLWRDSGGRSCARSFVTGRGNGSMLTQTGSMLDCFAEDLRDQAGLLTNVNRSSSVDGLHVLQVKGVDFYFYADGTGYDGWGRAL